MLDAQGSTAARFPWQESIVVVALAGLLGWPSLRTSPVGNHDVAVIAGVAERMLHGDRLYYEIAEPNPPLAFLAEMIPLVVAHALGWDAMWTIQVAILGLGVALVVTLARVCEAVRLPEDRAARLALVGLVAALHFGYRGYQLGQRDPTMIVAVLPYLVTAAATGLGRGPPRRLGVAAAVLGALGLALKPQFVLLPVLVEASLVLQTRSLRTALRGEALALWGVVAGFYLWVLVGTGYVSNVAAWKDAYRAYGALGYSYETIVERVKPYALMWAFPLLALRPGGGDDDGLRRLTSLLLVALAVAVTSVLVQGQGFDYHLWPVAFLSWLIVGASALRWVGSPAARYAGLFLAAALAFHVGLGHSDFLPLREGTVARTFDCPARPGLGRDRARCRTDALIEAVRAHTEPGDRVAVLATTAYPFAWVAVGAEVVGSVSVSPILLGDLYAGTRTDGPRVPYHRGEARGPIEERLLAAMADDLVRHEPRVLLVDHRPYFQGFGATRFDLIEFFSQDPRFAEAIAERYREEKPEGLNGAVRLFVRTD